jgi:hypothetical protein
MKLRNLALSAAGAAAMVAATLPATAAFATGPGHHPAPRAVFMVHSPVIKADGTSTARVMFKELFVRPKTHISVTLSSADVPSGSGACGTLASTSGTTGHGGFFITKYTSSSTVGFCVLTATAGTLSATAVIDQIDPTLAAASTKYTTTLSASTNVLKADGISTSTLTATVMNGATAVAGDPVYVALVSLRSGACGSFALGAPATDANGQVAITYTSSTKIGNCHVLVVEAATASHASTVLMQN